MKVKYVYLLLCLPGALAPGSFFVGFLAEHGFDVRELFRQLFVNRISAFFGMDVVVSAIVLLVWIRTERRRRYIQGWWLAVLGTLGVGVSFGLPPFLFLRERSADAASAREPSKAA
jgi:hypothetical protein